MTQFSSEVFKAFLSLCWLRPENGALAYYQSRSWKDVKVKGPCIDISTGDGFSIFLHCGGRFHESFDFFSNNTAARRFSHDKFIDIYDRIDKSFNPLIKKQAITHFTVGTDWKKNLLEKARRLRFFEKTVLHDNNILPLPFEDNAFKLVHSNAIYWTKNPVELMKDVHRILDRDSTAVFEVCTPRMLSTLQTLKPMLSRRALSILDRKRSQEMKVLNADEADWRIWIKEAGFTIEEVRVAWPTQAITDVWNIGLRPIAHLLIRMVEQMPLGERHKIKEEWTQIFFDLLVPVCENFPRLKLDKAPYITYILRKP